MKKQDILKIIPSESTNNRSNRLKHLEQINSIDLDKIHNLLLQLKNASDVIRPIKQKDIKGLSSKDVDIAHAIINPIYNGYEFNIQDKKYRNLFPFNKILNEKGDLIKVSFYTKHADNLRSNVFFIYDFVEDEDEIGEYIFSEKRYAIGQQFDLALNEVEEVFKKRRKKLSNKSVFINLTISDEVSKIYPKIKITDDRETGKMKVIGVGCNDIVIGRKDEQIFILVQNVLHYHGSTQDVEELDSLLENSKKSSKKSIPSKNTNALISKKRKHIIQVVSETNRTIKNCSGIETLISIQTKGMSTDEIKLLLNLNLCKTSG